MSSEQVLKFVVKDAEGLRDVVLSKADGGQYLEKGLKECLSEVSADSVYEVVVEDFSGVESLLGGGAITAGSPDIVILSLAAEMERLKGLDNPDDDVAAVRADLVAAIRRIKEELGAHILVTNVSTLDPSDPVFTYHGVEEQPWTLRGHRLNLMLIGVSHDEGISIVDVDRKIAEVGGDRAVVGAARYSEVGCQTILEEIVRIVEDYGFLDDRPIMEQVGAAAGGGS